MKEIDTSDWKEFQISELFQTEKVGKTIQTPTGAMISKRKLTEGDIPRVTVSNYNNGIIGYYSFFEDSDYRIYENFISVSFLGTVFYQPQKTSLDMKVHCLKPLKIKLNKFIAEFLVTVIRKAIINFAYADQLSSTVLPSLIIKLPVTKEQNPDFEYMETYIQNVTEKVELNFKGLNLLNKHKHQKDVKQWKHFRLDKLFDVVKGTRLTKADQRNGNINFISASSLNNGIAAKISNNQHIHPANTMTVSYNGSDIGRTFYQEAPYWASDDVNVLYPKFELNKNIALFLAPIIKAVGGNHVYKDKWLQEDMKASEIAIPVTLSGTPDWEYMNNYIENVLKQSQANLQSLSKVI